MIFLEIVIGLDDCPEVRHGSDNALGAFLR